MLPLISKKVLHRLDGAGAASDNPAIELSEDLWNTIREISNLVHAAIKRDMMQEELKKYLHCDEAMLLLFLFLFF
jgi:hypothetical protein